ncbi:MAG: hypothetical protein C0598_09505 [Marinilabiliales bacterium]|nr:MAG: hypothetical protein C0598_09505 [Marinilabiliales bacterium]
MKKQLIIILFITAIFSIESVQSQEMIGTTFGNYNGISSAIINPALMTGSKAYLNVNLLMADAYVKNDWAYIPKEDKTIWDLLSMDTLIPTYGKYRYNGLYTYRNNTNTKNVYQSVRVMGPSFMLQTGDHAFGLSVSARANTNATNIAYEMPLFLYEGLTYDSLQNIIFDDYDFNFSSMSWIEIAASWAWDFARPYKAKLTFGTNIKLNLGYHGAYNVNNNAKYIVYDPQTIQFYNYDSEMGYSLPVNYDSKDIEIDGPVVNGVGAGIDIGIVYTRLKNSIQDKGGSRICSKPYEDFIYRVGVSLLDIGAVSFSNNAQKHNFDNVNVYWAEFDTLEYRNINASMQDLSMAFYGDPLASNTGEKISIPLPTTLSLQFEGHFQKNLYVSALIMQPLRFSKKQLLRPVQYAITPRFENDYFALSIPVSIIQYKYMRIGTSVRMGPLTIGTERLGTLLGISDLDGLDIYVALKFSLKKGRCSANGRGACENPKYGYKKKFKPPKKPYYF